MAGCLYRVDVGHAYGLGMNTTFDSDSWLNGRLADARERLQRGEIGEAQYQSTVANLWRCYDSFIEYSCVAASSDAANAVSELAHPLDMCP